MFLDGATYRTDCCAKDAKDNQNAAIVSHELYNYLPVACNTGVMRTPGFQFDHPNLRGNIGYGLSDSCTIDTYSGLRNDPAQLTRDKCKIQLYERVFQGVPNLKPGTADPDMEMPILQGTSSDDYEGTHYPCKKTLAESDYNRFTPLVKCLAGEVQNEKNIVPPWTWGGAPTRDMVRRQEYLCQQQGAPARAPQLR